MNIAIIGTGYVGLVTGACLSEFGMNVICVDIDKIKIDNLKKGIIPFYEDGLEGIVRRNTNSKRLKFTSNIRSAIHASDVIFICVGTPTVNNYADIGNVMKVAKQIGQFINGYKVIVNKSTVPIGTCQKVKAQIDNSQQVHNNNYQFDVVSNPEFLREGNAIKDFIKPERIVIGADSDKAIKIMKEVYSTHILLDFKVINTNIETAEMVKYASNAYLATKISYINEIANLCELCNADVKVVEYAMGLDSRIGPKFLNAGVGFGGSCFPKDTRALIGIGKTLGYVPKIVKSTIDVNTAQRKRICTKIKKVLGNVENKIITVLGIAFKPNTDDIRDAPAIDIIKDLIKSKATIKVYDPLALDNLKKLKPELKIEYYDDLYEASIDSNCIVVTTEWDQFNNIDFIRLKEIVSNPVIFDLRNMFEPQKVRGFGFEYFGVGRQ